MNAPLFSTPVGEPLREPPHSYEAEQALLGAILMRNGVMEAIGDFLRPEHFADPTHGRIFDLCQRLIHTGRRADPVTIKNQMADDPGLADLGGPGYLINLAGAAYNLLGAPDYARLIYDHHMRRSLIAIGEDAVNAAFDTSTGRTAEQVQQDIEGALFALAADQGSEDKTVHFSSAIDRAIASMEAAQKADGKLIGITTGLADLDAKLGGLHDTDLIILAGRPSMGKSALGMNIAEAAAKAGRPTAFYSLEMSGEQLALRSMASAAGIQSFRIREGRMRQAEVQTVIDASLSLKELPLHIDDSGGLTVTQLRTRARRLKRRSGLDLMVVDYLQLMRGPATNSRDANRNNEISEITRALKALAKELAIPIVVLSQLSRDVEKREDKRPQLADLRDSGSIEQDADVVMFVYREEYYLERTEPPVEQTKKWGEWNTRFSACRNTAEIIIGKQRHGPTGTVKTHFDGNLTKFSNLGYGHGQD